MWTCEREHEQMSPRESFLEYHVDVDGILFDIEEKIIGDVEEYFATCHGWKKLDEKMDKK